MLPRTADDDKEPSVKVALEMRQQHALHDHVPARASNQEVQQAAPTTAGKQQEF
jgi:hypothetical protein